MTKWQWKCTNQGTNQGTDQDTDQDPNQDSSQDTTYGEQITASKVPIFIPRPSSGYLSKIEALQRITDLSQRTYTDRYGATFQDHHFFKYTTNFT